MRPIDTAMLKPVLKKISNLTQQDLAQYKAWKGLADLAKKTTFAGIEAHPSGVYQVGEGNQFEAVATVYLTLDYGKDKSFSNSFPAHIVGTISGTDATIQKITVDTSSLDFVKS
jgi:hypothetical protein